MRILFNVGVACILFLASLLHAQVGIPDRLTIDVEPSFPEADTPLSLRVRSLSLDLDRAQIAWYVNGTRILEGGGEKSAATTTGKLGSKTTITVEATGADGEFLTSTRVIQPAEVDILWESSAYVPPLYLGRRLASPNSSVRVEAVPRLIQQNGTPIPVKDIVFTWRKNGAIIANISGRGKSSVTIPGPELFGSDTISVEAASLDEAMIAGGESLIFSQEPFVLLYEDHPLFGTLFHRAILREGIFSDAEVSFVSIPFFANVTGPNDPRLRYAWRVNNAAITPDSQIPSRITINAEGSNGTARVALSLTHATDYIMEARGAWQLMLNSGLGSASSNLFGRPE